MHVNTLKINCVFCHFAANKSPDPGLPAVGTCMGCHTIVGTDRPEIQKLAGYYNKKQPVPWVRVHKVPEYVHFPHMRHVNAGVTCQSCHGQINNMPQVFQYASLNMGWCVSCHVNGYSPAEGLRAAGYVPIRLPSTRRAGRRRTIAATATTRTRRMSRNPTDSAPDSIDGVKRRDFLKVLGRHRRRDRARRLLQR